MIVGMGQVGRALSQFLSMDGHDVEPDTTPADMLHIAFPYSAGFDDSVQSHAEAHGASLVVVHSTVPVGTCDPHGWVHSPVRGQHPNLAGALAVTVKPFGGLHAPWAALAWPGKSEVFDTARTTEAGKLWELAQFGLQVRVTQAIYAWCEREQVDADLVYRRFAESYNDDYSKLGEDRFQRPVLDHVPGDIGGHCVGSSMSLLDHPLARIVEHGM